MLLNKFIKQIIKENIDDEKRKKEKVISLFREWIKKFSNEFNNLNTKYGDLISKFKKRFAIDSMSDDVFLDYYGRAIMFWRDYERYDDYIIVDDAELGNEKIYITINDFELALDIAETINEFIALSKQMNKQKINEHKTIFEQQNYSYFGNNFVAFIRAINKLDDKDEDYFLFLTNVAKQYFGKELGAGASRIVFKINDNFVLKLVREDWGLKHNRLEATNEIATTFPDILPKVYSAADNYTWIVVENVNRFISSIEFLKSFPEFNFLTSLSKENRAYFISAWIGIKLELLKGEEAQNKQQMRIWTNWAERITDWSRNQILSVSQMIRPSKLMNRLLQLCMRYDIEPQEIDFKNTGIAKDGRFVLLDLSILS